jgi:signal transduction histidine kinase
MSIGIGTSDLGEWRGNHWFSWVTASAWRVLIVGVVVALLVTVVVINWVMSPPLSELTSLVRTLGVTSVISLGIGFLLYRRGLTRSPSLGLTLVLSYVWAASLTLFNVWAMAKLMFASEHDFQLAMVLLMFAGLIATCFGVFVAASITDALRQLANTAHRVANGDLAARVAVQGRDEVARVSSAFNQMAGQLEESAREREELEALRSDLIAWVSHDLRTPLTSIRALVEALNDGVVTDEETTRRYYQTIRADILALNDLIDDLFELAQLDAGLELEMSPESISDLISDSVERFRTLGSLKGITVEGDVQGDLGPVFLNPSRISRVVANLLSNAIQYTPEGGMVRVHVSRLSDIVRVVVEDNGPGFKSGDLKRIFEKFYRDEGARSRATGGAGLGLAVAEAIVSAHNGRIWAADSPLGGAEVGFELPIFQSAR